MSEILEMLICARVEQFLHEEMNPTTPADVVHAALSVYLGSSLWVQFSDPSRPIRFEVNSGIDP